MKKAFLGLAALLLAVAVTGTLLISSSKTEQLLKQTTTQAVRKPAPVGYVGVLFGYRDGKALQAAVVGKADTMQECLKDGADYVAHILEEAPPELNAVVACVPIPPSPPARQASNDPKPTDDQKVTRL